ncbi:MAG: hypothetical protein KF897_17650 [Opitutaceae bacterium]|nr:hypothetical protein [Opitutaceae bacterium]
MKFDSSWIRYRIQTVGGADQERVSQPVRKIGAAKFLDRPGNVARVAIDGVEPVAKGRNDDPRTGFDDSNRAVPEQHLADVSGYDGLIPEIANALAGEEQIPGRSQEFLA